MRIKIIVNKKALVSSRRLLSVKTETNRKNVDKNAQKIWLVSRNVEKVKLTS